MINGMSIWKELFDMKPFEIRGDSFIKLNSFNRIKDFQIESENKKHLNLLNRNVEELNIHIMIGNPIFFESNEYFLISSSFSNKRIPFDSVSVNEKMIISKLYSSKEGFVKLRLKDYIISKNSTVMEFQNQYKKEINFNVSFDSIQIPYLDTIKYVEFFLVQKNSLLSAGLNPRNTNATIRNIDLENYTFKKEGLL